MSERNPFSEEPIRPAGDQQSPQPRPDPVVPLDYAHGRESKAGQRTPLGSGIVTGCLVYLIIGITWVVAGAKMHRNGQDTSVGLAIVTVCLLFTAIWIRRRYRFAGLGYGILLALALVLIGIPLLIFGFCYFMK
jgi:hypothetical protein